MVTHSRTPVGTHGLRPLGLPRPVVVDLDAEALPAAIEQHGTRIAIAQITEVWRITEGWWREAPITRTYVHTLLEDDRLVTLFHDDTCPPGDGWYEQHYS